MSDKNEAKKNLKAATVAACYVIAGASVVDAAINQDDSKLIPGSVALIASEIIKRKD